MLKSYSNYLGQPNVKNLQTFVESAIDYDFADYKLQIKELFGLYLEHIPHRDSCKDNFLIESNGSSNQNNSYAFGPNCKACLGLVENFLRGGEKQTFLFSCFPLLRVGEAFQILNLPKGNHAINFDIRDKRSISELVSYLQNNKPKVVVAKPNLVLYLSNIEEFIEGTSGLDVILTSTDWEAFYDRSKFGFRVNDQMIDWKSGINFYTCDKGYYHFLPIFAQYNDQYFNLLNLNNKTGSPMDDLFEIGNDVVCDCGKRRLEFKFIPHWCFCPVINGSIFYDLSIAKKLNQPLYNFQFLQKPDSNSLTLVYSIRGGAEIDFELTDCKLEFTKDHLFHVGRRKHPSFWRGDCSLMPTRAAMWSR